MAEAMFDQQDKEYFARRAANARKLANEAADPAIRRLHAEFAEEYERRAKGEEPRMLLQRPPQA